MITPRKAYGLLLRRYGPRGWWPVTPPGGRRPRYSPGRYGSPGPRAALEICLGAILTQNTAWGNVVLALEKLQGAKALDLRKILGMRIARLQRLIRSSGFFVEKSKKLKTFLRHASSRDLRLDRWLRETPLPVLRAELLSLHGVGPETADSMLLYAGGRRTFVIDAYTKRIGGRLGWFAPDIAYEDAQRFFARRVPKSVRVYQEYHALLVELGKQACRPKPRCQECPLQSQCPTA